MIKIKRIHTNGLMIILAAFIIGTIFIAADSMDASEEITEGFHDLEKIIIRQDSTLTRQGKLIESQTALIETQTGKINELELTIEALQQTNENYKHELDSVYSIINFMQRNYVPKRNVYERFSPNQ